MKLLIDDEKAAFIEQSTCGCYPHGMSINREECPLHCDATIDGFIADRHTLQTRIAELEKERDRLREFEPRLVSFENNEFTITVARNAMARLVEAFASLNGEANYTVTTFQSQDPQRTFEVVVREQGKPSEHDMRKRAEARCAELEAQLDAMRAAASDVCKMVVAGKAEEEIAGGTDQ